MGVPGLVMTFTVRHGFSMALIEIDGKHDDLPINSMVDLSMASPVNVNNQMVTRTAQGYDVRILGSSEILRSWSGEFLTMTQMCYWRIPSNIEISHGITWYNHAEAAT